MKKNTFAITMFVVAAIAICLFWTMPKASGQVQTCVWPHYCLK